MIEASKKEAVFVPCKAGEVSDGYHTFDELYEHRITLFIALINSYPDIGWKSKRHSDLTEWDGWFIAGMRLPTGDISYHLPNAKWGYLKVASLDSAPKWDGHTSNDVVKRLEGWASRHIIAGRTC